MGLQGRVAIVTGGARGIGRAICFALARRGAKVAVTDIDYSGAERTAEEIRDDDGRALAIQVDVTDRPSVKRAVQEVLEQLGRLDILVNNAGICPLRSFEEISDEEWDRVLSINLKGAFICSQEAIKPMCEQGWGRIINISSVAGKMGGVKVGAHYAASKGGLIALTFCLARQYAASGITANVIAPATIETDLIRDWSAQAKRDLVAHIPLGRLGQPKDVAAAVVFLASEEAGFITGEVLDVNGGFLMD